MSTVSRIHRRRIGEILIDEGLISKEQVDEAVAIQAKTSENLGAILVDLGYVSESDIVRTIVAQFQLPYIRLENYQVDEKLVEVFPVEFLHQHKLLPFDRIGSMILCAVTEVPGEEVLAEIPRITKQNVALYVSMLSEVSSYLNRFKPKPQTQAEAQAQAQAQAKAKAKGPEAAAKGKDSRRFQPTPGGAATAPASPASAAKTTKSTSRSSVKPKAKAPPRQIFEEESNEALLQALDSSWNNLFEGMEVKTEPPDDDAPPQGSPPKKDGVQPSQIEGLDDFFKGLA
jgi:hypothetical protein